MCFFFLDVTDVVIFAFFRAAPCDLLKLQSEGLALGFGVGVGVGVSIGVWGWRWR